MRFLRVIAEHMGVGFILLALIAMANGDCPDSGNYAKSTNFIVPQTFFNDGISRYNAIIQQELDILRNHQFADMSFYIDKCKHGVLQASKLFNRQLSVSNLAVVISDSNSIHVSFLANIYGQCPGSADYGYHVHVWFVDFCVPLASCGGTMTYAAALQFDIVVNLQVDPGTCLLSLQAGVATAKIVSQTLDGCSVPSWLESILAAFGFDVQQVINQIVENMVDDIMKELTGSFVLPPETQVSPNIYVAYEVEKLVSTPNEQILVYVNTRVRAISGVTGQSVTYAPPADLFNLRPSDVYNLHPSSNYYITSEARISDEVLHAYLWAYQAAGFHSAYGSIQILDANITVNLTWSMMDFVIPSDNFMVVTMDTGVILGDCGDKILFEATFTNLTGTALFLTVQNGTQTGIYLQIISWYQDSLNISLIYPQIMLPASLIQDFVRSAAVSCIDDINAMLSENILWLPSSIAPYAPNSQVELVHQDGCCNNNHGYLQISIKCACTADPTWHTCTNVCPTTSLVLPGPTGVAAKSASLATALQAISAGNTSVAIRGKNVAAARRPVRRQNQGLSNPMLLLASAAVRPVGSVSTIPPIVQKPIPAIEPLETIPPTLGKTKLVPNPTIVLMTYNSDGSRGVSAVSAFYSYFAKGECLLTPYGFYEVVEPLMNPINSQLFANINSMCPNSTCTGCYANTLAAPFDQFLTIGAGAFQVQTRPDCIDLGPLDESMGTCFFVKLDKLVGTVTSYILACSTSPCTSYPIVDVLKNIVVTASTVFVGCPTCNGTNCSSSVPLIMGDCIDGGSVCLESLDCPAPYSVNVRLLITILVPSVIVAALIVAMFFKRKAVRRHATTAKNWTVQKGHATWAAVVPVGLALKMFLLYLKRNRIVPFSDIQWALYASTATQLVHMAAFIGLAPLDIFCTNNLGKLGFDSKYINLQKYDAAFNQWSEVALITFVAAAAFTALIAFSRVFILVHSFLIRICTFLPMLALMNTYLVYPTVISFKFLITINPSSNPYLNTHPDTVASFQLMLGDGLSGLAVAFLTNQSLLLFSGFAVGALSSGWLQDNHENLVLDTFLAIFCAMIPFVVMIPVLILYHAISDQSIVWIIGWVNLMLGIICGIGFLYLKLHDSTFHKKAVLHNRYNRYFLLFGTLFTLSGLVFVALTLYVESAYELVSIWYLLIMIFSAAGVAFAFCYIMRSTKAFVIDATREDLPVKLFHSRNDYVTISAEARSPSCFSKATLGVFDTEERFRFFCLLLGVPLLLYVVYDHYHVYLTTSAKQMFADMLNEYSGQAIIWPEGPTVLDPCFAQYDVVRNLQMWFLLFSAIFYTATFVSHVIYHFKTANKTKWLVISQACVFIGVLFTVACVTVVSTPDYLSLISLNSIVPTCGPDFDRFVDSSVNLSVGLVQTLLSVVQTAGIILSFLPTFNRVLYTRIRMLRATEPASPYLSIKEHNLRNICVGIAFMSVFITSLPLLLLRQISSNEDTAILSITIIAFWLLPGLWLKMMIRLDNPTTWYLGYILTYFACAMAILAAVMRDQINQFLQTYLTDPMFYLTVVSSICISSVAIGDALRLMFGSFELFDRQIELKSHASPDDDDDEGVFGPDDQTKKLLGALVIN